MAYNVREKTAQLCLGLMTGEFLGWFLNFTCLFLVRTYHTGVAP